MVQQRACPDGRLWVVWTSVWRRGGGGGLFGNNPHSPIDGVDHPMTRRSTAPHATAWHSSMQFFMGPFPHSIGPWLTLGAAGGSGGTA